MNAKTVSVAHQYKPESSVDHLLLPQTSTTTKPIDPRNFGIDSFAHRATTVSVVLKEILEEKGVPHGGIND